MSWLSFVNPWKNQIEETQIKPKSLFPRKIILAITTHGCVSVKNTEPVEMIVPDGMKIVKLSATGLGEVNITNYGILPEFINEIKYNATSLLVAETENEYTDILRNIANFMKEREDEVMIPDLISSDSVPNTNKTLLSNYFNQRKNKISYRVNIFNSNQRLIDKKFTRSSDCEIDTDMCGYDYKINMVNIDNNPDLLELMPLTKKEKNTIIYLHDIVEYLNSFGVKEIIIFDFSCSSFMNEKGKYVSEREKRSIKRKLLRESPNISKRSKTENIESKYKGYGGKSKRKTKRKTKGV